MALFKKNSFLPGIFHSLVSNLSNKCHKIVTKKTTEIGIEIIYMKDLFHLKNNNTIFKFLIH